MSSIERAKSPSVSRDPADCLTPEQLRSPYVGLNANIPQKEPGLITDPVVWVPIASGPIRSATAAAEPLDEPPGVQAKLSGFRVLPGWGVANSVVTVFPINTPPALRLKATQAASALGRWPA